MDVSKQKTWKPHSVNALSVVNTSQADNFKSVLNASVKLRDRSRGAILLLRRSRLWTPPQWKSSHIAVVPSVHRWMIMNDDVMLAVLSAYYMLPWLVTLELRGEFACWRDSTVNWKRERQQLSRRRPVQADSKQGHATYQKHLAYCRMFTQLNCVHCPCEWHCMVPNAWLLRLVKGKALSYGLNGGGLTHIC